MFSVLVFSTLLILLVTLLPMLRCQHWTVRGLDFPRLQFAFLAAVLLVAQGVFLDLQKVSSWAMIGLTLLCLLWQLCWIVPYTRFWKKEVRTATESDPARQLCLLTCNVLTPNRNAQALRSLVLAHQPDVLVTLESDQWWEDQLESLEEEMPYTVKCPLDNLYGMHLYSRLPLDEAEICYFVEEAVPSIHATITLRSGDNIRAHFLHPAPPSPTENIESAERDAELVIVAQSLADGELPVIVTGDLNDVAWSATTRLFRKISGLLDPRVGRGMYNTFHAGYPFIRWPLDHVFHSHHFTLREIRRLPSIGSDHFPLLTRLVFTSTPQENATNLSLASRERQWAENISAKQKVSKAQVPTPGEAISNEEDTREE